MLKLEHVSTTIGTHHVIHDVSLEIAAGSCVALLGGNGAGKSTLFRTIAGLVAPTTGTITFKGRTISHLPADRIVRRGLALCPEGRQLFPGLTVHKNLMLGAHTVKDRKKVADALEQVYALFPVLGERARQLAGTFSGGEQQMLAMGRALMSRPQLLLLDEPSIGLAPLVVEGIADAIQSLNRMGMTIFLSEQNARIALMITRYGYVLENGALVIEGPSSTLMHNSVVRKAYLGT
ncbi:ABC transporter ATP-binding protein [Desulfatitalea alkaliphila]|uniref:ABC transporter ATP-binding protein n=1 Tax=Desulfatitalea alkaliphila TaxID=2929485 RepID=A0AA41R1S2_9BACT|nr:ABC transporter ATP-binding protein [Desulfatitalea alkaliphila]MCJ8499220.1 ABC transporter ATP-binding protein [Desulfatitalea alkaliphila]